MIHWGSSIPCALFINNRKECVINLPDSASWDQITSEVSQKFHLAPERWLYTLTDLGASQEVATEEQFRRIKESCVRDRTLLQLNVCTRQEAPLSGVTSQSCQETDTTFQRAVEEAVRRYLAKHGAELVRELAHQNKLCCCNTSRAGSGNIGAQHQEVVFGDMVLDNSDSVFTTQGTGNSAVFTGGTCTGNSSLLRGSSYSTVHVEPPSTSSSIPLYSTLLSRDPTPPSLPHNRNRKSDREETDPEQSNGKKAKVIPPDREYILAPCKNNIISTPPDAAVEVVWSLVVKRGVRSRWELVDEGGTIHPVGGAGAGRWTVSTDNIQEFAVQFVAPAVEGVYESRWTLKQDGIVRETVTLCRMKVITNPDSNQGSGLACHGNIPADVSVPKFLNSNKVFCMSSNEAPSSSNT
ncbi:hypothetical protein ACHWQZ_G017184 [Mnemiopsis leidyi]